MLYMLFSLLLAVVPAVLLIFFIVGKDKKQPEPPLQLVKAFFMGVVAVVITAFFNIIIGSVFHFDSTTVGGSIGTAFLGAAIPEECAKMLMLWLLLRRNKYFDEHFDGIVYAVMVGLGFALVENLLYMFDNYNEWLAVGISRAFLSVPAHYAFAVFMGYYYSLACFESRNNRRYYLLALFVPILLHGLYDALLMVSDVMSGGFSFLLSALCLVLCYKMHKEVFRRLNGHLQSDSIIIPVEQEPVAESREDNIEYIDYEDVENKDVDKM